MPRKDGMQRKDLLEANAKIFRVQGQALDTVAKKTVKVRVRALVFCTFRMSLDHRDAIMIGADVIWQVLVVGNPANTNALITAEFAPSIPKTQFTALTRLDHVWTLGFVNVMKLMSALLEPRPLPSGTQGGRAC